MTIGAIAGVKPATGRVRAGVPRCEFGGQIGKYADADGRVMAVDQGSISLTPAAASTKASIRRSTI